MKNKNEKSKLDEIFNLLQQLVAIQLYTGGAKQKEVADNLGISVGKVNGLIKGVNPPKKHEEN